MATVPVKLVHAPVLTSEDIPGLTFGQSHWWLRGEKDFVRLPRRVRGDQPLDLLLHLEPGHYLLGVGPAGQGVREDVDVPAAVATTAQPVSPEAAARAAGKTLVITGDLEAMSRDEAAVWFKALGAKVTGSVSAKTSWLVVGYEPGPKKIEKAAELGIEQLTEADLRERFDFPTANVLMPLGAPEEEDDIDRADARTPSEDDGASNHAVATGDDDVPF